jgi:hypothetical protein
VGLKPHLSHLDWLAARLKSCPFAHIRQVEVFQQSEKAARRRLFWCADVAEKLMVPEKSLA